jgi:DNA-binding NarL/FixJ family response regulator
VNTYIAFLSKIPDMNIKVCVFDDHKKVRDALGIIIKGTEGFEWGGSFADCNNVLKDVEKSDPDVVLMDIEMPGMSGIDAVKLLHQKFPHIKVIMQTAFDDDDKVFYSICFGASGYLLKSTSPAKMLEAIQDVATGGAPMTPSIAKKVLLMFQQNPPSEKRADHDYHLSQREKDVLELLVKGKSYKMIGDELFISYETVRSHMKNIYEKLHVASMTEAVAKALQEKLVSNH